MQQNVLEVKLKLLVFFSVLLVMQKEQKLESVNIQSDYQTMSKMRTDLSCVYTQWKSMKRWRVLLQRMITKQQVKK